MGLRGGGHGGAGVRLHARRPHGAGSTEKRANSFRPSLSSLQGQPKQMHVFKERKLEEQYFFLLELKRLALAQLAVLNVHIGSAERMQQQIWFGLLK